MRQHIGRVAVVAGLAFAGPATAWADGGSELRPYISLRTSPGTGAAIFANPDSAEGIELENPSGQNMLGAAVGVDWGRYWGFELSGDFVETTVENANTGQKIAEYGVWTGLAQLRLRFPMMDDRLVPYALVGGGFGVAEGNDSNTANTTVQFHGELDVTPLGVAGAGLEYFIARNIALGLEAKYRFGLRTTVEVDGVERDIDLDSLLWSMGLRVYFDEAPPGGPPPADSDALRAFLALRAGAAVFTASNDALGLELSSPATPAAGFTIGVNLNKYLGVELAVDTSETEIDVSGVGSVGEYRMVSAAAQARARYPIMEDRLVPYVVAGGGMGFAEYNDRKVRRSVFDFDGNRSYSPLATLGAGIEYFVAENVAIGFEAKEVFLFDGDVEIEGATRSINQDAFYLSAGIRLFFP